MKSVAAESNPGEVADDGRESVEAGAAATPPEVQSAAFVMPVRANAPAGLWAAIGRAHAQAATVAIKTQIELRLRLMHVLQGGVGPSGSPAGLP